MIWSIIIGGLAGWLAGTLMKGKGYGLILNILLGLVGGALGGWIFGFFGFSAGSGFVPQLTTALVGALVLIYLNSLFSKK